MCLSFLVKIVFSPLLNVNYVNCGVKRKEKALPYSLPKAGKRPDNLNSIIQPFTAIALETEFV